MDTYRAQTLQNQSILKADQRWSQARHTILSFKIEVSQRTGFPFRKLMAISMNAAPTRNFQHHTFHLSKWKFLNLLIAPSKSSRAKISLKTRNLCPQTIRASRYQGRLNDACSSCNHWNRVTTQNRGRGNNDGSVAIFSGESERKRGSGMEERGEKRRSSMGGYWEVSIFHFLSCFVQKWMWENGVVFTMWHSSRGPLS